MWGESRYGWRHLKQRRLRESFAEEMRSRDEILFVSQGDHGLYAHGAFGPVVLTWGAGPKVCYDWRCIVARVGW